MQKMYETQDIRINQYFDFLKLILLHTYIYMHVRSLRRKHAKAKQQPLAKDCFVQTGHSLVVYEGAVAAL